MADSNREKKSENPVDLGGITPDQVRNFTPQRYQGGPLVRNWDGSVANKPTTGQFFSELAKTVFTPTKATQERPKGTNYSDYLSRNPVVKTIKTMADPETYNTAAEVAKGFGEGFTPEKNPVVRFVDKATDARYGFQGAVDDAFGSTEKKPESTPTSTDYSGMAYYGLGGAGAGALLGAALGRKGKRGQGALLGAGLGGGAGLLAHYLASQKKAAHIDPAFIAPLVGAVAGGGIGALTDKKHRLRNALIGAGIGGGAGAAAEYALPGAGLGMKYTVNDLGLGLKSKLTGKPISFLDKAKLMSGRVGEIGEYATRRHSTLPGMEMTYLPKYLNKSSAEEKKALDIGKTLNTVGSFAKDVYNRTPESVRAGIGMGGLGGAALGGLAGLVAPGEDVEYNSKGRAVKRNPRNRFGAMMRGALGGGVLGAGAGAAAGHFAPQHTQQAADYLRGQAHNLHQKYLMSQLPRQEVPTGMMS